MTTAFVDIELREKLERFKKAMLDTVPGISEDSAKRAADRWERNYYTQQARQIAGLTNEFEKGAKKQEQAAQQAAEKTQRAWEDTGKKLLQLAGGPMGDLGDVTLELIPKAHEASAALGSMVLAGAGVAGVAAAWTAAGAIVLGIATQAEEAEARLLEAGLAAEIPAGARASIEEYRDAQQQLRDNVDLLTVSLGQGAVEAVSSWSTALAGALAVVTTLEDRVVALTASALEDESTVGEVATAWEGLKTTLQPVNDALGTFITTGRDAAIVLGTLGLAVPAREFYDLALAAGEAQRAVREASAGMSESAAQYAMDQIEVDEDIKRNQAKSADEILKARKTQMEREAQEDLRRGEEERRRQEQAAKEAAQAGKERQDQYNRGVQAGLREFDRIAEEQRKQDLAEEQEHQQELLALQADRYRQLEEIGRDATASLSALANDLDTAITTAADGYVEQYRAAAEAVRDMLFTVADAMMTVDNARLEQEMENLEAKGDALDQQHDRVLSQLRQAKRAGDDARADSLRAELAAIKTQEAANKRARTAAAKEERENAIFSILVDGAAAVLQAFAMFGPPPSPQGIIAAAAATIATGAQIAALPPVPSAFVGLDQVRAGPDGSVLLRAHQNEALLPSSTTAALGPEATRALASGQVPAMGGGGGDVWLDGELVGNVMARRVHGTGALANAVHGGSPVGMRSPYGRS